MRSAFIFVAASVLLAGCAPQEQAQQQLIGRMQQGLGEIRQAQEDRQKLLEDLCTSRRRVLDAAFDQDVKQNGTLDAAWVIEHRKAYSMALEAMFRQEQASAAAHQRIQRNLQVIDENLSRLSWMSELRENWSKTLDPKKEVTRGNP
jgi:hypothetical protein